MAIYQVGKPYNANRRSWPEGAEYNFRGGGHELRLAFVAPTRHEVAAAKMGESEFALFVEPPLIVLCYRFGVGRGIPWSDAPYSWHRMAAGTSAEDHVLPIPWEEGSPQARALLNVILIDADDGIIRVLRAVTWSPEFTRAIHKGIWEQAHAPFDQTEYDRALAELYRRFPTSEALANACPVRTKGGD